MTTEEEVSCTAPTPNEHEDPSLSSASLCIQFDLLGETFGPVFTHQSFRGEWIRGYHPPLAALKELTDKATAKEEDPDKNILLHSSHVHHEAASKELSIVVSLAPSCEECHVEICTEQKRLPRRQSVRASKRRRIEEATDNDGTAKATETESENEKEVTSDYDESDEGNASVASEPEYNTKEKEDDSEFEADEGEVSEVEGEDDKEGSTRKSRMPTKEILQSMKKGIPPVVTTKKNAKGIFLRRPLGVELKEYSARGKDFVLCLASGQEASKFHTKVQGLALWFIETADDVDVASKEGGFWKVLYILQRHQRNQYSLAGYTTLFHFHSPFKKPKAGYVVRICQALVLPPYQRSGHGKQMLTCVMDIAHGVYAGRIHSASTNSNGEEGDEDEIVEINVESPAPAFVMLRNRTDYDCFLRSIDDESQEPWFHCNSDATVTEESFFTSLPETDVVLAASKAKIIPRQIQIVQELYKLQKLHDHVMSEGKEQKEELEKRFRLMVKKRLNKEHREDLSGFRTKAEKQSFLEEEFRKCLESYQVTLPKP